MPGFHTEWAPLEKFLFLSKNCTDSSHSGQDHEGQTQKANQAANVAEKKKSEQ
jgi:hypothetical protein